MAFYLCAYLQC